MHKLQYQKIWHRSKILLISGLILVSSLTLISCGQENQNNSDSSNNDRANASAARLGIKTKVLHMGYQQAGDLVRVTHILEKRLSPLGIKVEWYQFAQGPQLMEAMDVGKIDIGAVGETPPIFAQAAGSNIVYIVGSRQTPESGRGSAIVVPADSPIKQLKDIKGQKVVFQKASASHYFILRALEEVGLKYSDIQVASIPTVESSSAFLSGKIPVWVTGDPYLAIAEKAGKVRILRDAKGIGSPGGYYVGGKQFAIDNPGLLRLVIEEIDKIYRWADTHRPETAKLIVPYQKLPLDIEEVVLNRRTHALRGISPALIQEQQRVADYFYHNGLLPKPINIQAATLTAAEYAAITPQDIIDKPEK